MQKQLVKIIIEGTDNANTRGIALALSQSPRLIDEKGYWPYTTVISTKWGNFKDFPWGENLIEFEPTEEDQAMKKYSVWARLIELQGNYNWIIDRFHISTQQYQLQFNNHNCDFNWLEERLLELGFHLILVTQSAESVTRSIANQEINNKNDEVDKVIQKQDLLRKIVSKSVLPRLELDISEMNIQETAESIIDWFESVSSYTQPEEMRINKIFLPSCS
jgi:hypothetical protein